MKIPILAYHSLRIDGNEYENNDSKALATDLIEITRSGFQILPLHTIVTGWLKSPDAFAGNRVVALSCDDGTDFDFYDLPHPSEGMQRSVLNTLHDFQANHRGQSRLNITSFVIASPEARLALDRSCMIGKQWWNEDWWPKAIASGLMHIGNHSWDHNHAALPGALSPDIARGTFTSINTKALADYEIETASSYLWEKAPNEGAKLFAYPYGNPSDYLVSEYFPRHCAELRIEAAFTDDAGYLSKDCSRWKIPRFMSGRDWNSPAQLQRILRQASG